MKKLLFALFVFAPVICFAATSPQQLFDQYFALSNALSQDSVAEAKKAAKDFGTTTSLLLEQPSQTNESVKVEDLPHGRKDAVRQSLSTLLQLSRTIANVDKLDQMRKPFEEMTALMGGLQTDLNIQADPYYCPMMKKVWLQPKDSKKVQNPYGGKSMATCGEKRTKG